MQTQTGPDVKTFFDEATFTATHLVWDPSTKKAVIIDPVMDYCPGSGEGGYASAAKVLEAASGLGLTIERILETHIHADHLSAAVWLRRKTGARIGAGTGVTGVQGVFREAFNLTDVSVTGAEFDELYADGAQFALGDLTVEVWHTPGHTQACISYVIGDAAFVGDTLFMPDYGTARCDFPGGDSATLWRSIQRLLALPEETRVYLCHDYKAPGRDHFAWETTVKDQRSNIHVNGHDEDSFVAMRDTRDATLAAPRLLQPSLQVNIRAGALPEPDTNGVIYLKQPVRLLA